MAIQNIEETKVNLISDSMIDRVVHPAASGLVMEIVQSQQYTKPIPSTVRELTANAVDSQNEKIRALQILSGKASPSQFFVEREGELYEDSKWDPTYYNPEHLSAEDKVYLTYISRPGTGRCDSFIVLDYGVGLSPKRLEGATMIGFSTKRNRKDMLGAFGIGAKVGLATQAPFYKVETVYNGIKLCVLVYNKSIASVIPSFNVETEESNIPITLYGETIYGERTTEKNYTKVEVSCLKHHKQDFILAVKSQLLYFNCVEFNILNEENEEGTEDIEIDFKAEILYESDNIIIASNGMFSKPHIVITRGEYSDASNKGICYGYIDFKELELDDLNGNIGIKCPIRQVIEVDGIEQVINEGVDVIPSREAVRWTNNTREYILKKFQAVREEADIIIQNELKADNFFTFIRTCHELLYKNRNNTIVSILSNLVDVRNLRPKFADTDIKFAPLSHMLDLRAFSVINVSVDDNMEPKQYVIRNWSHVNWDNVYIASDIEWEEKALYLSLGDNLDARTVTIIVDNIDTKLFNDETESDLLNTLLQIQHLLRNSGLPDTADVNIPEDFGVKLAAKRAELELAAKRAKLNTSNNRKNYALINKERKQKNIILLKTPRIAVSEYTTKDNNISNSSIEIHKSNIKEGSFYYNNRSDWDKVQFLTTLLVNSPKTGSLPFLTDKLSVLGISKNNYNLISEKNLNHIDDFFGKEVNGCIEIHDLLLKWNTARLMNLHMDSFSFMYNYEFMDINIYKAYKKVSEYVDSYYYYPNAFLSRAPSYTLYIDKFIEYMDHLSDVQLKGVKCKYNGYKANVVDMEIYSVFLELLSYAEPISEIFNNMRLFNYNYTPEPKVIMSLKKIVECLRT